MDSTAAIDRIRTDKASSGQRFAIAAASVCAGILTGNSDVTVRWVPAHHGILGNEKADEFAKADAFRTNPRGSVADEYW